MDINDASLVWISYVSALALIRLSRLLEYGNDTVRTHASQDLDVISSTPVGIVIDVAVSPIV